MTDTTSVTMHSEMGRQAHPAVNIKVTMPNNGDNLLPLDLGGVSSPQADGTMGPVVPMTSDPAFTFTWIEHNVSESAQQAAWDAVCEEYFALAKERAQEAFEQPVQVFSEGRSGGWLVVYGLPDVEDWTPEDVERWTAFAKDVRQIADDVPRGWLDSLYVNEFERWLDERDDLTAAVLTRQQQEVVKAFQAYNVPASWFIGVPGDNGEVEVIALGTDPEQPFIWSFAIQADGDYSSSQATVGEFSTGIDI